jgi:hypothetical protein
MKEKIPVIQPDFQVHKALYALTNYPGEDFNNVLRRLLNLDLAPSVTAPSSNASQQSGKLEIRDDRKGVYVEGIELSGGGIKVFKGGRCSKKTGEKFQGSYANLRLRLLKDGVLNSNLEFVQDYSFNSKSAAASVILGRQANGDPWG